MAKPKRRYVCQACGSVTNRWQGPRKRGVEIVGIILGFVFLWPAALAYLVWKLLGYPIPVQVTNFVERHFSSASRR